MPHPLAADLLAGYFNTTSITNDTTIPDALVLAAVTFPVLNRPENPLAEQAVLFRFIGSVVDGFGLEHLAIGLIQDHLRAHDAQSDGLDALA